MKIRSYLPKAVFNVVFNQIRQCSIKFLEVFKFCVRDMKFSFIVFIIIIHFGNAPWAFCVSRGLSGTWKSTMPEKNCFWKIVFSTSHLYLFILGKCLFKFSQCIYLVQPVYMFRSAFPGHLGETPADRDALWWSKRSNFR